MISVLCPTRNRPNSVRRLVASALATAAKMPEFVFYTDDDAPGSVPQDVRDLPGVIVVTGERIVMSDMWNRCAEKATGDILMLAADDIAFRTRGWDDQVRDAFTALPDGIGFVHGADGTGIHPEGFGTHGFVTRAWTDAAGHFTPPYFSCDYADTWLNDLADRVGRNIAIPILTEHLHPAAGKAAWDESHAERRQRGARDDVAAIWARTEPEREAAASRLRAVMEAS